MMPITFVSPQDLEDIRVYLRGLMASRRAHRADSLASNIPAETLAWLHAQLPDDSVQAVEKLIQQIELEFKDSPIVEILVAAPLSDLALAKLVEWLRREAHPAVMIRQQIDRRLMGGAKLRTSRSIYDLSISGALGRSREQLTEVIHGWS
ncbi:MAG: F0F1 ATP synthase subunit delta [bacterium]